jgi:RimJ/RimL family protein N-acetyltransferase
LIEAQLEVLLARDEQGQLTVTRGADARPAPRLFLGRSGEANTWAVRADVDPATRAELDRLCAAEPRLRTPDPAHPPRCRSRVLELLAPVASERRGPAYVLAGELRSDDRAREVSFDPDAPWLQAFPWLSDEFHACAPVVIAFDEGRPAAVCHSPRGRTASAAEAGVETLEPFRGRGLATAAVACWARAVRRSGRVALYSTPWENAASRGVAGRLSARLYGEDWELA